MKKHHLLRVTSLFATIALVGLPAVAQKAGAINEQNVRAEMYFLASDAMQGRGSGSGYERIAAEYIGSQFMQFGLEPAGEAGFDGKPSYVQTVSFSRNSFAEDPWLKFGTTTLVHGKEMIASRANSDRISGPLQKLNIGDKPNPGAVVFVTIAGDPPQNLNQALQAFLTAGASMVIAAETPQQRTNWATLAGRRPTFTINGPAGKPAATIVVSKDAAASIAALADGTNIAFGGALAAPQVNNTWNAIGKITGSDASLGSEVILLSSHLDHLGLRPNAPGDDKIYNGADDDASGSIAVLEMARTLGAGKKPKRTVYFVCFGSEEAGGFGANYFVNNTPFPKEKLVANLEFEMIGRPDTAVKPEELWLTGFERSNLGPELAKRGARLVQDPHPDQNFFQRSDNYTLARQGIIAHTVSSYGLHKDYHQASDEIKTIDFAHMTKSINSMVAPIQWLINSSFVPAWNPGKNPKQ